MNDAQRTACRQIVAATSHLSFVANQNTLAARNVQFQIEELLRAVDEWRYELQAAAVEYE